MKIVFVYKNIIVGGCELLIEKICKQLASQNVGAEIVCLSVDNIMQERFRKENIRVHTNEHWNSDTIISSYKNTTSCTVVVFTWHDFVLCNVEGIKTLLYIVHPKTLRMGEGKYEEKVIRVLMGREIKRIIGRNQLIAMSEGDARSTKEYYKKDIGSIPIVRICIEDTEYNENYLRRRAVQKEFNILAIARAEFPFKGYLKGLIKWFSEYSNQRVELTIITYGAGETDIYDMVKSLDDEKKKRLTLIGKTDYNELEKYFSKAKLYVGMGTTLLDASIRGVLSVPVLPYTEELVVNSFFTDNFRELGLNSRNLGKSSFSELVNKAMNLSEQEYLEMSYNAIKITRQNYSAAATANNLLSCAEKIENNHDTMFYKICRFYYLIKDIITRRNIKQ